MLADTLSSIVLHIHNVGESPGIDGRCTNACPCWRQPFCSHSVLAKEKSRSVALILRVRPE